MFKQQPKLLSLRKLFETYQIFRGCCASIPDKNCIASPNKSHLDDNETLEGEATSVVRFCSFRLLAFRQQFFLSLIISLFRFHHCNKKDLHQMSIRAKSREIYRNGTPSNITQYISALQMKPKLPLFKWGIFTSEEVIVYAGLMVYFNE